MGPKRLHHRDFSDAARLTELKAAASLRVSVCIPALNEAETIVAIIESVRKLSADHPGLVDELLVIDSNSTDGTREIAKAAGATVYLSSEIAPHHGTFTGKGENLWKALHIATGDIICFVDGDISNFHSGFITGLVGPLLCDPSIDFVKAYYDRPLERDGRMHSTGGGRVSEILVRPLLSLFYPELAGVLQPLSGEYAARRSLLETLPFPTGYGVEVAHLIDFARKGMLDRVAQTDLVSRIHRNRDDAELGRMAFAILRVVLNRLQRDGKISLSSPLPELYQTWKFDGEGIESVLQHIPEPERPPLVDG